MFKKIEFVNGRQLLRVWPYPNERVPVLAVHSEVMCHFGLAGKLVEVALVRNKLMNGNPVPDDHDGHKFVCQVYTDGKPFSAPILPGEGGFYCDYFKGQDDYYTYAEPSRIDPRDLVTPGPKIHHDGGFSNLTAEMVDSTQWVWMEMREPGAGWKPLLKILSMRYAMRFAKHLFEKSDQRVQLRLLDEQWHVLSYFDVKHGEIYSGTAPIGIGSPPYKAMPLQPPTSA